MERTSGSPAVTIGLIDGPVFTQHPQLASENLREIIGRNRAVCVRTATSACAHGTFVAGILLGRRSAPAPAISPNCTLLIRPVFTEVDLGGAHVPNVPSATPLELAGAILECIHSGARVINLSLAIEHPSP